MVLRDRKDEFLLRCSQSKSLKEKPSSKIHPEKHATNFGEKFVKIFLRKAEQLNEKFAAIDKDIADVVTVQRSILEFSSTDDKLFSSYNHIKTEIVTLSTNLNKLEKSFDPRDFPGCPTELRICNTQILTLKKRLGSCVSHFFSIQEEYKEKCKTRIQRQAQIAGVDLSKVNLNTSMSRNTNIFLKKAIPDYNISHSYLEDIKKRQEEFLKTEKSLEEMRDLFFSLAIVLQADFPLIDRVDKHSLAITGLISKAKENAISYKSGTRFRKFKSTAICICVAVVLTVCATLGVVFFF